MEEKEIKIQVFEDFLYIKKVLESMFDIEFTFRKSKDVYFDKERELFNLNHALRLRQNFLTYKALLKVDRKNPWFIFEKEFVFPIEKNEFENFFQISVSSFVDKNNVQKVLNEAGYFQSIIIEKETFLTEKDGLKFSVDKIEGLGVFIEVEGDEHEEIISVISKIGNEFKHKKVLLGYTNLYAEKVLGWNLPDFDKKYSENVDWNFGGFLKDFSKLSF